MEDETYGDLDYDDYEDIANVPGVKKKEDVFTLFRNVWSAKDSSKVANLSQQELGMLPLSVRNNLYLANLGSTFGHEGFADFFKGTAEIISATSMAKKGWFTELFVSQKKFTQKSSSQTMSLPEQKSKWSLYKNKQQQQPPQV